MTLYQTIVTCREIRSNISWIKCICLFIDEQVLDENSVLTYVAMPHLPKVKNWFCKEGTQIFWFKPYWKYVDWY